MARPMANIAAPVAPAREGLSQSEADRLLEQHGPNEMPAEERDSALRRTFRQLKSPLSYILLAAIIFETLFWLYEGRREFPWGALVIGFTLGINVGVGLVHEHRSQAAIDRLKALASPRSWVMRDGHLQEVPSRELVPGDVVRLEAGDRVPADGALLSDAALPFDESLLTGESFPVDHADGEPVHAGTLLLRGRAHVLVQRTGSTSALGKIASLLAAIELGKTPLERRLDKLGHQIAVVVLLIALVVSVALLFVEGMGHLPAVLLFAAALAVAAVPEELPATLALTLALGVERMAKKNALLRRLPAVESLGSVTVICTDKTGTLTHNRLSVRKLHAADDAAALRAMILANDATLAEGDPLDVALLAHASANGIDVDLMRANAPRVSSRPFDSAWRFMRVTVGSGAAVESLLKGAPEALFARARLTPAERARWDALAESAARQGHRVLALARAPGESEEDVEMLGLVELADPPRDEAKASIAAAQGAGIRVALLTGDHPATALSVARHVGIPADRVALGNEIASASDAEIDRLAREVHVFARILPEHKLRLVEALQRQGEIVAMVGDGVNDAPALKRADIGVAMGKRGSDVAREAAALVLLDDNFATIVDAIEEGRGIHAKTQTMLRFMFSTSLGFVLLILGGILAALAFGLRTPDGALLVPLTAIQILWINFLADGPPAFALGVDKTSGLLDQPPPRPEAPLLDKPSLRFVLGGALTKAAMGLALFIALPLFGVSTVATRTSVFLYEYLAQLTFASASRAPGLKYARNRSLWLAMVVCVAAEIVTLAVPMTRIALGITPPTALLIAIALVATALTALVAVALRQAGDRPIRAHRNQPPTSREARAYRNS